MVQYSLNAHEYKILSTYNNKLISYNCSVATFIIATCKYTLVIVFLSLL